jgi:hypothetical protein
MQKITSLCVGANFHGIPSPTSALNCTAISLYKQERASHQEKGTTKLKKLEIYSLIKFKFGILEISWSIKPK